MTRHRGTSLLLNVAHALDHMFLLVFATAIGAIAAAFGMARWEDLMPYGVGAFALFGLASLPAGRLGDHWGRRRMMLVFFFGMGASMLLIALTESPWQLAGAMTLMGAFSSIYHPVGIPMLVRESPRPGLTIGVNGLAGNLGVALAAITTGFLVKYAGWRAAFACPPWWRSLVESYSRALPRTNPRRPRAARRRRRRCRRASSRTSSPW
jgi:MFS family permease